MSDNKISKYLRLNDNHPTMIKLHKLENLAEELGLSMEFGPYHAILCDRDRDPKLPYLIIEDIENNQMDSFPFVFEYKVIYDNPKYLEQQQKEREEYELKRKAQEEAERMKAEQKKLEQERKAKERIEKQEKEILKKLKEKYESQQ